MESSIDDLGSELGPTVGFTFVSDWLCLILQLKLIN